MAKRFNAAKQSKTTDWKKLAISRRLENKELNKRLTETKASREKWKVKALSHKHKADSLQRELESIKKKVENILA
jgi:hypothetical protein